ncbi:MAG TPA: transporter substrate-binding domain-containing protein [Xanthobacteraceae bacterium]|nr:transporter substrate-binding domain-containing protein [Xanthobacteraceae bacterium]
MSFIASRLLVLFVFVLGSIFMFGTAFAQEAVRKELLPMGKLRVGIALGLTPGAGNVVMDASGEPRGISADLGRGLARKLGVQVEWVPYANSGALTEAADSGAWDVAFIPVDEQRKQKVDFGAAHIVLQSTFLVAPGSKMQTLADVDKPRVRAAGVQNTATARAAQASLKNVTMIYAKNALELFDMLRSGKVDAVAQSRESLMQMAARLPGSRLLPGSFLNSYVAVAMPKNRPAALAFASAYVEEAKATGYVRQSLDRLGMQSTAVAPAGAKP